MAELPKDADSQFVFFTIKGGEVIYEIAGSGLLLTEGFS